MYILYTLQCLFVYKFDESGSACGWGTCIYTIYTVPSFISLMRVEACVVEVYVYILYSDTLQSPFVYKFDESGSACGWGICIYILYTTESLCL